MLTISGMVGAMVLVSALSLIVWRQRVLPADARAELMFRYCPYPFVSDADRENTVRNMLTEPEKNWERRLNHEQLLYRYELIIALGSDRRLTIEEQSAKDTLRKELLRRMVGERSVFFIW